MTADDRTRLSTPAETEGAVVDALFDALRRDLADAYELERELGRGGMAVVYRAVEKDLHRKVALKVLPPGHGGPDMAERFKREARMAAALDHPNIIPVYRVGQAAGTHFFAMKLVEGRAVDAILESQGALSVPVVVQILRASASALAFAHERAIVHRDIKGANILVDRDGRVLVSDFGIARAVEEKALTASGSVMGTPHFMSPEQCAGQKVGPQSDQYSLGILGFQMLTGSVPFDADSLMGILQHHFFTPMPDIAAVREGVPPQLITVVRRALAKQPEERYATTKDMVADLDRVPLTDAERRDAEEMLRLLAIGDKVPQVRTASLPPLPDPRHAPRLSSAPTVPMHAVGREAPTAPSRPSARPRALAPAIVAGAVVVALAGTGLWWQASRSAGQRARVAADSTARAESLASARRDSLQHLAATAPAPSADSTATASPASRPARNRPAPRRAPPTPAPQAPAAAPVVSGSTTLSLRTVPTNADVSLDGRSLQQGGVIGLAIPAGPHRLVVSASGCVDYRTTFTAQDGVPVNLRTVTLQCQ